MRFVLLLALLLPPTLSAEPLRVFVSVLPMQAFVEKIGDGHVQVRAMVRPGYSPATYDPTPQQIAALAEADLYVRVGVPFERAWMARIRAANAAMRVVDARHGIDLRTLEAHEHGDPAAGRDGHEADPHVWTSPPLVKQMGASIRDELARLDPAHAAEFAANYSVFAAEMDALDRDVRAVLTPVQHRRFLVFHPAWGYFADTYDLVQVPIEREGKQPGARALAALIGQARSEGIRVVFVQPQFDKRQAGQVAQAIGGRVVAVDPLAADYGENLRRAARSFAEAMRP